MFQGSTSFDTLEWGDIPDGRRNLEAWSCERAREAMVIAVGALRVDYLDRPVFNMSRRQNRGGLDASRNMFK